MPVQKPRGRIQDSRFGIADGAFLLFAIALSIYALVFYHYPQALPVVQPQSLALAYPKCNCTDLITPPVSFSIVSTFKAQGDYSADNTITVHAVIYGVNLTDFFRDYGGMLYSGSYYANDTSKQAGLYLKNWGNGTYTADGQVEWETGGPTYVWLIPRPQNITHSVYYTYIVPLSSVSKSPPVMSIGSINDTNTWRGQEFQNRIGLLIVAFLPFGAYETATKVRRR